MTMVFHDISSTEQAIQGLHSGDKRFLPFFQCPVARTAFFIKAPRIMSVENNVSGTKNSVGLSTKLKLNQIL